MTDHLMLRRGAMIRVEFDLVLPENAIREEILDWVSYRLGQRSHLHSTNPLQDHQLEALAEPVLSHHGYTWNELAGINRLPDGARTFTTCQKYSRHEPPPFGAALTPAETIDQTTKTLAEQDARDGRL